MRVARCGAAGWLAVAADLPAARQRSSQVVPRGRPSWPPRARTRRVGSVRDGAGHEIVVVVLGTGEVHEVVEVGHQLAGRERTVPVTLHAALDQVGARDDLRQQVLVDAGGSALSETLNAVSAKLTTDALTKMGAKVGIDHAKVADVAKQFLTDNGLM